MFPCCTRHNLPGSNCTCPRNGCPIRSQRPILFGLLNRIAPSSVPTNNKPAFAIASSAGYPNRYRTQKSISFFDGPFKCPFCQSGVSARLLNGFFFARCMRST